LNHIVKSLITKEFQEVNEIQVLKNIENIINFTKTLLQADEVIIWIEDSSKEMFWSFDSDDSILLSKSVITELSNQGNIITKDNNPKLAEKVKLISNSKKDFDNILFHKVVDNINKHIFLIEIINIKNNKLFETEYQPTLDLLSTLIIQTVHIKGISSLAKYYFDEQTKAYTKQQAVIQNDFKHSDIFTTNIFYKPSDILNGDSYSLYKTLNGDIFIYVLDAMGHGIGPSLTAYSMSAVIKQKIKTCLNFHDLMEGVLDNVQYILTDEEQLTCGFFWFSKDLSSVEYVVAGMYAPMILDNGKVISAKANNIPFMNFAFDFSITKIALENFQKFMIFTDGLVEDTQDLAVDLNRMIFDDDYCNQIYKDLEFILLDDDTTIVKLIKLNKNSI